MNQCHATAAGAAGAGGASGCTGGATTGAAGDAAAVSGTAAGGGGAASSWLKALRYQRLLIRVYMDFEGVSSLIKVSMKSCRSFSVRAPNGLGFSTASTT